MAIIYCDMDGVMTDFDQILHKKYPEEMKNKDANTHIPLTDDDWTSFNKDPYFWHFMPPMNDAFVLWDYIKKYEPHMLTAWAGCEKTANRGKWFWCNRHLEIQDVSRFNCVKRDQKVLFAKTNGIANILIDDYKKNIEEWIAAGGIGILHISAEETIRQLKLLGY